MIHSLKKTALQLIIGIFILSFVISSCKKDNGNNAITTNAAVKLDSMDIAYGTDPAQKIDIYLPVNRTDTNTKVFVMIHGGAWSAGDKSGFNANIPSVQAGLTNYAIININYRLAVPPATNLWPTQLNDINAAFDYIVSNANYYHYNATKIAVYGESAGAHLGMLKAYQYNYGGRIKAMVDVFGPKDMADLYNFQNGLNQQLFSSFMGGTPTTNPTAYTNASPLSYVNQFCPPTIIFHGTADSVVPYSQSVRLNNALEAAGVGHQYNEYPGEPHGQFSTPNAIDAFNKGLAFTLFNLP